MSDRPTKPTVVHLVLVDGRLHLPQCNVAKRAMAAAQAGSGPANVATDEYRTGWEGIFGKKQTVGEA